MRVIHKIKFPDIMRTVVDMPSGFIPLKVDLQDDDPCLWYLCDPNAKRVGKQFVFVGTGHPIEDGLEYIGQVMQSPFVWHLFMKDF